MVSKQAAVGAVRMVITACPEATNSDPIVMAGNACGAFSHTYGPQRDAGAIRRLRWAIAYVKGGGFSK